MKIRDDEVWNLSPSEAIARQRALAAHIVRDGDPEPVRLIAGVDVAVGSRSGKRPGRGAVVILSYPDLKPVEQATVERDVSFPYIPGLLSFREIPVLLPAFAKLRSRPDLLIVDGQGMAHPRRIGIASHLGLLLDLPSIGCAKSRLTGVAERLNEEQGSIAWLADRTEIVGAAVRTRANIKPVYVSIGHKISLDAAIRWVLLLVRGFRLPEPTRLAHQAAAGSVIVE